MTPYLSSAPFPSYKPPPDSLTGSKPLTDGKPPGQRVRSPALPRCPEHSKSSVDFESPQSNVTLWNPIPVIRSHLTFLSIAQTDNSHIFKTSSPTSPFRL